MDTRSKLKISMIQIFENKPISQIDDQIKPKEFKYRIEEVDTEDILYLLIPFINSCYYKDVDTNKSKQFISEFMNNIIILFQIDSESCESSFHSTIQRLIKVYGSASRTREDKIFVYNITKSIALTYVDWEDREFLINLLVYSVCRGIQISTSLEKVEPTAETEFKTPSKPSIVVVRKCGHSEEIALPDTLNRMTESEKCKRSEILRRRIEPTMTLDEYANIVMEDLRKREEYRKPLDEVEFSSDENSREKNTAKDEQNESVHGFLGRTKRQG